MVALLREFRLVMVIVFMRSNVRGVIAKSVVTGEAVSFTLREL